MTRSNSADEVRGGHGDGDTDRLVVVERRGGVTAMGSLFRLAASQEVDALSSWLSYLQSNDDFGSIKVLVSMPILSLSFLSMS